jgi:hypothetical protein
MAIGESGRIVLEVEPELKRLLYSTLALEHKTLKEWFLSAAQDYIAARGQGSLFDVPNPPANP